MPSGESCFIDANILGYASIDVPPLTGRCRAFLERVVRGELTAFTTAGVVADALFKTLIIEFARRFAPPDAKPLKLLQAHPEWIARLSHYPAAAQALSRLPIQILPVDWATIEKGVEISVEQQLLTNDAILVGCMRRQGLRHLVTNDDDFDVVADLTVWKPR